MNIKISRMEEYMERKCRIRLFFDSTATNANDARRAKRLLQTSAFGLLSLATARHVIYIRAHMKDRILTNNTI